MLTAIALTLAQAAPTAAEPNPIPPLLEVEKRIAKRDAELFWYAFEGCDPAEVRERVTDDFRMLHDLAGVVSETGEAFTAMLKEQCDARAPGGANEGYKNRRLLVPGSDQVTWLGRWGVLHRGWHTFHEWRGDEKGWVQTGGARFINVWKWMPEEGRFRMQETISVDHGAVGPYKPEG
ncbi:MAG: DUF4440 domain-containing protein [Pseudomonadota bacterium]|nr:DUF4440 domain-containing protein [Pseudomonadota bacterium]